MRLLLIDDNVDITSMFEKYLTLKGYDCVVSNNGKNGLNLIKTNQYDYVLLDLAMPEFGGVDIINSLEKDNQLKDKKIIILTASSISDIEMDNFEKKDGIIGILKKPVQLSELLQIIV